MDKLGEGWFSEVNDQWPGQATSLQVKKKLWDKQSKYQHVQVFESVSNGVTIVLDDVIQLTEKDEPAYHEMFAHIGLFAHPKPERVLVVGGGDGGILREVAKHPSIKEMVICDIDQMVGEVSRKFMPAVGCGYDDPRVKVVVEDANKFLDEKELQGKFDVILSDTSDPVGPAQFLFEAPFYQKMHNCLAPGGIVVTQAENIWLTLPLIERLIQGAGKIFANVQYAVTQVPTYPSGIIGLFVCKKEGPGTFDCSKPMRKVPEDMKLTYYTSELHTSSFSLPAFAEKVIEKARLEVLGFNKHNASKGKGKKAANTEEAVSEEPSTKKQKKDTEDTVKPAKKPG
eukprot:gb/GEZN01007698.1/.p1 GENE.gb/GEZN01007698.1/~~gb/GEZN01007698.1/.p1  ORF type:complete len:341 (+),score=79.10 gb/GEZN01007698.1/:419-1441(+)